MKSIPENPNYNFEEIKEIIMPYLENMYCLSFTMSPYNIGDKKIYFKDNILITIKEEERIIECLGLEESHKENLSNIAYNFYKEMMDKEYTYEPSPEELEAEIDAYNEFMENPYEDIHEEYIHEDDVTPIYCNIISAMVCYMNSEFTREQLTESIKMSTDNNKDVIEHLKTII